MCSLDSERFSPKGSLTASKLWNRQCNKAKWSSQVNRFFGYFKFYFLTLQHEFLFWNWNIWVNCLCWWNQVSATYEQVMVNFCAHTSELWYPGFERHDIHQRCWRTVISGATSAAFKQVYGQSMAICNSEVKIAHDMCFRRWFCIIAK